MSVAKMLCSIFRTLSPYFSGLHGIYKVILFMGTPISDQWLQISPHTSHNRALPANRVGPAMAVCGEGM